MHYAYLCIPGCSGSLQQWVYINSNYNSAHGKLNGELSHSNNTQGRSYQWSPLRHLDVRRRLHFNGKHNSIATCAIWISLSVNRPSRKLSQNVPSKNCLSRWRYGMPHPAMALTSPGISKARSHQWSVEHIRLYNNNASSVKHNFLQQTVEQHYTSKHSSHH